MRGIWSNGPIVDPAAIAITGGSISNAVTGVVPTDISNLYKFRAALGRMATGGTFVKIAHIGDSITAGGISNASVPLYRPNAYPARLARVLTAYGISACATNAFGNAAAASAGVNPAPGAWDSRLSGSGSFSTITATNIGLGGYLLAQNASAAGTLTFTPGVSTDTCDIYSFDQTGVFTVNVDGGATITTVTGGNTQAYIKTTVSYAAGTHAINIVWVSGPAISIGGFDAYTVGTPQLHHWNLGSAGALSGTLAANTNGFDPIKGYKVLAPDLAIISTGTNDAIGAVSLTTYFNNMQAIATACQLSGDVIFMTFPPIDAGTVSVAVQNTYIAQLNALAVSMGIPIIDEYVNLVSKVAMTARGVGSDTTHPNNIGHDVIARDMFTRLKIVL